MKIVSFFTALKDRIVSFFASLFSVDLAGVAGAGYEAQGYQAIGDYEEVFDGLGTQKTLKEFAILLQQAKTISGTEFISNAPEEMRERVAHFFFEVFPTIDREAVKFEFWKTAGQGNLSLPVDWAGDEIRKDTLDPRFLQAVQTVADRT